VVCSDTREMQPFSIVSAAQEAAMAAQNMLLKAHSLGLGSCVVSSFSKVGVIALLDIPYYICPIILIALGFPAEIPTPPLRKPLSHVIFWERYNERQ